MTPFFRSPPARGFSLVEVTLALGIAAFCLVAVFGLLPVGVNTNQASIMQTAASSAAASITADLRATPRAAAKANGQVADPVSSPFFNLKVPSAGDTSAGPIFHTIFLHEDGSIASSTSPAADKNAEPAQNPIFRATVFFYPPAKDAKQRNATTARVLISWPALADPNASQTPTRYSGSVESVAALDRN